MQVAMLYFIVKIAWILLTMWIIFCVLISVYKFLLFWFNLRDNKIEVGTFKYQFLGSKRSMNFLIWYFIKVDKKTMYKW